MLLKSAMSLICPSIKNLQAYNNCKAMTVGHQGLVGVPLLLPPASLKGVSLYFVAQGTLPEMQADPGRLGIRMFRHHAVQCFCS